MKPQLLFPAILFVASLSGCVKEETVAPAQTVVVAPAPKGIKLIYVGPHPSCEGALLFQTEDGKYVRATEYPESALALKAGDVIYAEYELMKLKDNNASEFATPPVIITTISAIKPKSKSANRKVD